MNYEVYKNIDCKYKKEFSAEGEDIISLFEQYISKEKGVHVYVDLEIEWHRTALANPVNCCRTMKNLLDECKIDGDSTDFKKITGPESKRDLNEKEYCMFLEVDLSSKSKPEMSPEIILIDKLTGIMKKLEITKAYSFELLRYLAKMITLDDLKNIEIDGWVYIIFRVDYSFKDDIIEKGLPPPFEYLFIPCYGKYEIIKRYFKELKSLGLLEKEYDGDLLNISEEIKTKIEFIKDNFAEIKKSHKEMDSEIKEFEENMLHFKREKGR